MLRASCPQLAMLICMLMPCEHPGFSAHVAQRACLEVHQRGMGVTYEAALHWIRQNSLVSIDRWAGAAAVVREVQRSPVPSAHARKMHPSTGLRERVASSRHLLLHPPLPSAPWSCWSCCVTCLTL